MLANLAGWIGNHHPTSENFKSWRSSFIAKLAISRLPNNLRAWFRTLVCLSKKNFDLEMQNQILDIVACEPSD